MGLQHALVIAFLIAGAAAGFAPSHIIAMQGPFSVEMNEAMLRAVELGINRIHRDSFHAALGTGRYLLALCWYKAMTKKDITGNAFNGFDIPVTEEERAIVINAVNSVF